MKQIPQAPETPNIRVLAQEYRDRFTDITDTVTLSHTPLQTLDGQGLEMVVVDGVFRDPETYTIEGNVLTWETPLAGTETVVIRYPYRS